VTAGPVAVIDCGTNSTRLLVLGADGSTLVRDLRTTRLGAGVDATGRLDPAAIARTVAAVEEFTEVAQAHGVVPGARRVVATSAARDAANHQDLFDAIEAVAGVAPELLSGEEEAQLTYLGSTTGLGPVQRPRLVVDIGGGSTELVIGSSGGVELARSLDVGCVRLTERHLRSDPYLPQEIVAAARAVDELLAPLADVVRTWKSQGLELVGVAGTVTTAAAIDMGLTAYVPDAVHRHVLTLRAVQDQYRELSSAAASERRADPRVPSDRADVIVAGILILRAIMENFEFGTCLVSEHDILDGIAVALARS